MSESTSTIETTARTGAGQGARSVITDNAAALVWDDEALTGLELDRTALRERYGHGCDLDVVQGHVEACIQAIVRRYRPQWELVGNEIHGPAGSRPLTADERAQIAAELGDQVDTIATTHTLPTPPQSLDVGGQQMTNAEFLVITEDLGLHTPALARILDRGEGELEAITDQRVTLPHTIQDQIADLETLAHRCAATLLARLEDSPQTVLSPDDAAEALAEITGLEMPCSWHIAVLSRIREQEPALHLPPAVDIEVRAHGLGLTLDQLAGQIRCHVGPTDAQWIADLNASLLPYSDAIDALQQRHDDHTRTLVRVLKGHTPAGSGERTLLIRSDLDDLDKPTRTNQPWNKPLDALPNRWHRAAAAQTRRQVELLRLRYVDPSDPRHLTIMKKYPHI